MNRNEQIYNAFHVTLSHEAQEKLDAATRAVSIFQNDFQPKNFDEQLAAQEYEKQFAGLYTHGSTAIEGSTLTLVETQSVIENKYIPTTIAKVKDMYAVRGVYEGYNYLKECLAQSRELTSEFIKDVHERTALECDVRVRGSFRTTPVKILGTDVHTSEPADIYQDIDALLYAYQIFEGSAIVKAAAFHIMFENIHPFIDGNGRCGRHLMNYVLMQEHIVPIAITQDMRAQYLETLNAFQAEQNCEAFVVFISNLIEQEAHARMSIIKHTREFLAHRNPSQEEILRKARKSYDELLKHKQKNCPHAQDRHI